VGQSASVIKVRIIKMIVSTTMITKMKGKRLFKKFLKGISLLLNLRLVKIKVNITKGANVKHQIAKRNIVNVLREELNVILINVNVKIAKMGNVTTMHTYNLKISKIYTVVQ
jgi:hypothetical protein